MLTGINRLALGTFTQQLLAITNSPDASNDVNLLPRRIPRAEAWLYGFPGLSTFLRHNLDPNRKTAELTMKASGTPGIPYDPPLTLKASIYNGLLGDDMVPITANCPTGSCT